MAAFFAIPDLLLTAAGFVFIRAIKNIVVLLGAFLPQALAAGARRWRSSQALVAGAPKIS